MAYIHRLVENQVLASLKNNKILFVLGARQVGKTTLLKTVLGEKARFLNLDIELDRTTLEQAASLRPDEGMRFLESPEILVIDEAHLFPRVGRITKGWFDFGVETKIILSGSSTLDLLDRTAESLVGRNEKIYLTPLMFKEILGDSWHSAPEIQTLLMEHLTFGGYPEGWTSQNRPVYLDRLITDFLLKDLLQTELIKGSETIKRLLLLLAYQIGNEVSVNELANNLSTSRVVVDRYLDLLERIQVIFRLPAFSSNSRKEIAKSKKVYFWDTGLRNGLIRIYDPATVQSQIGPVWENWVVAEFAKRNLTENRLQSLFFWRTPDGSEVDLVVKDIKGEISPYEIKWAGNRPSHQISFFNRYRKKVRVINKNNFADFLAI